MKIIICVNTISIKNTTCVNTELLKYRAQFQKYTVSYCPELQF